MSRMASPEVRAMHQALSAIFYYRADGMWQEALLMLARRLAPLVGTLTTIELVQLVNEELQHTRGKATPFSTASPAIEQLSKHMACVPSVRVVAPSKVEQDVAVVKKQPEKPKETKKHVFQRNTDW